MYNDLNGIPVPVNHVILEIQTTKEKVSKWNKLFERRMKNSSHEKKLQNLSIYMATI